MAVAALPRPLRFVFRNWPLKLGAVALATVLYAGLVVSQNARLLAVRVPIEPIGQRTGAFLLETLPDVTSIRFYAPSDVANRLTGADFRAVVDLGEVQPARGGAPQSVPVQLEALDPRVSIIDFQPRAVSVRLDLVAERVVPVVVEERGEVPGGVAIGQPRADPQQVTVRGASSLVARVARAVAPVSINPDAINVDQDVALVPVDDRGEEVAPVDLEPERARIFIAVETEAASRTLPVSVQTTGSVAPGYVVRSITTNPVAVTVLGEPAAVTSLTSVPTVPVDVTGRSTTLTRDVDLALPEGVTLEGQPIVEVRIRIAPQETSRSFPVGLTLANARADRTYALSTPQVVVVLGGAVPTFEAVDVGLLSATVDVANLEPGEHALEVDFTPPAGLRLVSVTPTQVIVTVGLPPTPVPAESL